MFHSRTLNNKINKLYERALRITYDDETSTFDELLRIDGTLTIHERNLQKLATLMYKVKNNLCPKIFFVKILEVVRKGQPVKQEYALDEEVVH